MIYKAEDIYDLSVVIRDAEGNCVNHVIWCDTETGELERVIINEWLSRHEIVGRIKERRPAPLVVWNVSPTPVQPYPARLFTNSGSTGDVTYVLPSVPGMTFKIQPPTPRDERLLQAKAILNDALKRIWDLGFDIDVDCRSVDHSDSVEFSDTIHHAWPGTQ